MSDDQHPPKMRSLGAWDAMSRDWIIATLLDPASTDGEVEAAVKAATPAELQGAREQLDMEIWWNDLRLRDLRGAIEHMADQNPGLT